VLGALGEKTGDDEFAMMEQLHALTGMAIPANLRGLEGRPVRHRDVIDTGDMLNYVLSDVLK
jgi:threonine synthase